MIQLAFLNDGTIVDVVGRHVGKGAEGVRQVQ